MRWALATPLSLLAACSAQSHSYLRPGYAPHDARAVKRVAVLAWAPADHAHLPPLMARIAGDRLKLRTNYIVTAEGFATHWAQGCQGATVQEGPPGASLSSTKSDSYRRASASPLTPTLRTGEAGSFASTPPYDSHHSHPPERLRQGHEGVLFLEVLDLAQAELQVALALSAELRRCSDGALLWRAEGDLSQDPHDANLRQLVAAYLTRGGPAATRFAAPIFALVQDVLAGIPNPTLTDEELLEKIDAE